MSKIVKKASCGNEAQNADCVVTIEPSKKKGITFELTSLVAGQFGKQIEESTYDELKKYGITDAKVSIVDRGAIDPVLRARLEAAIKRGMGD